MVSESLRPFLFFTLVVLFCFCGSLGDSMDKVAEVEPVVGSLTTSSSELRSELLAAPVYTEAGVISLPKNLAIRRALDGIGARDYNPEQVRASVIRLRDQCLPFLSKQLNGRATWRVEFTDVDLEKLSGDPKLRNSYIRSLIVILCPDSGQILRVVSRWPEGVPAMAAYPSCLEEERQYASISTRFTGLPGEAPSTTLFRALGASLLWSPAVKQISASYVMESSRRHQDRPVWVIQLRGFPAAVPFSTFARNAGIQIPDDARNHLRNVIDAKTGNWLYADTIPQPIPPLEFRY